MNKTINRLLIPGLTGNLLEWYDFSIYAYLAPLIGQHFFPSQNKVASLISTFGVFAAGFLARPIGAIIFGRLGDQLGRKATLVTTISIVAVTTTAIGLLPSFQQIGILAGILLTLLRLLQGLALGGEIGYSIYLIEHAPSHQRGLYGCLPVASSNAGFLLGSAIAALMSNLFSPTVFSEWAWRIPFILSFALGGISLYFRLKLPETPEFLMLKIQNLILKNPFTYAIKYQWRDMLRNLSLATLCAVPFYVLFVYLPSYENIYLHIPIHTALTINTISMSIMLVLPPIIGHLSDKIGRRPLLLLNGLGLSILSYPLFLWMAQGAVVGIVIRLLLIQCLFAILVSFASLVPVALTEILPSKIRYSASALPYNLAGALFGGTAPLITTALTVWTGNPLSPSFYLIFIGILGALAVWKPRKILI